jgi:formate hydrogenlyase subunit 3/multisubunit Na+/H+ antiporter MnhD subunit
MTGLEILIKAHSGLRWVVLALVVMGIGRAGWGWLTAQGYTPFDRRWGAICSGLLDLQVVLGFVIFFLLDPELRPAYWHPVLMILAAVSVHLGSVLARRTGGDRQRHYAHLLAYLTGLLLVLLGVYAVRGTLF